VQELLIHQIELEMQREELQHSRDQLEEALSQYTDLYDFAPVGYMTLECNSTIRRANMTAEKILGIDRALLIGDRLIRFVDHTDRIRFNTFLERVFSHKEHLTLDLLLRDLYLKRGNSGRRSRGLRDAGAATPGCGGVRRRGGRRRCRTRGRNG